MKYAHKHSKAKILFGVDDKGNVKGQDISSKTLKDLSAAIAERIKPQVIPVIKTETYDEGTIIVVEAEGYLKPYSSDGNYLIRSGCENRKIEPELLKQLVFPIQMIILLLLNHITRIYHLIN